MNKPYQTPKNTKPVTTFVGWSSMNLHCFLRRWKIPSVTEVKHPLLSAFINSSNLSGRKVWYLRRNVAARCPRPWPEFGVETLTSPMFFRSSVPAKKSKRNTDSHWFPLEIDYYLLQILFQSMLVLSRPKHVVFTWLNWPSKYNCGVNSSHVLGEQLSIEQFIAFRIISPQLNPLQSKIPSQKSSLVSWLDQTQPWSGWWMNRPLRQPLCDAIMWQRADKGDECRWVQFGPNQLWCFDSGCTLGS